MGLLTGPLILVWSFNESSRETRTLYLSIFLWDCTIGDSGVVCLVILQGKEDNFTKTFSGWL